MQSMLSSRPSSSSSFHGDREQAGVQKPGGDLQLQHMLHELHCQEAVLRTGRNADVHELDEDPKGREMERALAKLMDGSSPVPAVFIGGRIIGSTDRVMALHLRGDLVQLLREAGALWL
ncbi:hypothetical protein HPP92_015470 [Vanilla planifolia]|uniref:Uncharacterized protein n=1 Tax=Vanilla planifolia TaxID=51239 RepID=A0A835QTG2_VANPL|nr:hypothetical protein HPP92_015470 [Vanilla planifolia]